MLLASILPSKIESFLTFRSVVPVPVVPTSSGKCGTDVPTPTRVRLFGKIPVPSPAETELNRLSF